jgi:hypothetical protein
MTVEIWWYVPGRILYSPGSTDKADIAERNAKALALIEAEGKPPQVHTLIDHTNRYSAADLPHQPRLLKYYIPDDTDELRQKLISHPLLGWVVSINTPNVALKLAGAVVSQQSHYRWKSCTSLEEALEFLENIDLTLGKLPRPEK